MRLRKLKSGIRNARGIPADGPWPEYGIYKINSRNL